MGKLRKKHNWKGRQQSETQQPADKEKTEVVVELQGMNFKVKPVLWSNNLIHVVTSTCCLFGW